MTLIRPLRIQHTLSNPVSVSGFGYWSGLDVRIEFRPAAIDTGITFVRADLPDQPRIPACVGNRIDLPLRTALASGTASVEMVEHIMAALASEEVDNCEVWVDRAEMPGMDGSSQAFVDALRSVSRVNQARSRARLVVTEPIRVGDETSWIEATPSHHGEYYVEYQLDYTNCPAIGRQCFGIETGRDTFANQLANARTFLLEQEAQWLRDQGLGQKVTYQDLLVFGAEGPINNTLRYEDECVRHKTLDVIGDLALAGYDLDARIVACRSGHRLNAEMVRCLLHQAKLEDVLRISA